MFKLDSQRRELFLSCWSHGVKLLAECMSHSPYMPLWCCTRMMRPTSYLISAGTADCFYRQRELLLLPHSYALILKSRLDCPKAFPLSWIAIPISGCPPYLFCFRFACAPGKALVLIGSLSRTCRPRPVRPHAGLQATDFTLQQDLK